jgi:hypothetical protein
MHALYIDFDRVKHPMIREPNTLDRVAVLMVSVIRRMTLAQEMVDGNAEERIRSELKRLETENSNLKSALQAKEISSPRMLEAKLLQAQNEILELRSASPYHHETKITSIPVDTEGRDAMYWHQICRTLQHQCTDLSKELERKTNQLAKMEYRDV